MVGVVSFALREVAMLLCPVCHEPLVDDERGAACAGGHQFDRARERLSISTALVQGGDSMERS